jgi:V-type H+-transporting ATPase subunit a
MPILHPSFIAGVVPRARMQIFERINWRLSRGNCYMNFAEIEEVIKDPNSDTTTKKNVFIIFAHGKELLSKLRKACESLGATIYPVDERSDKRREDALEVISRLEDLKHVLDNTKNTQKAELYKVR